MEHNSNNNQRMKSIITLVIIILLSFISTPLLEVSASDDLELNWYFVRKRSGQTPEQPKDCLLYTSPSPRD